MRYLGMQHNCLGTSKVTQKLKQSQKEGAKLKDPTNIISEIGYRKKNKKRKKNGETI